MKFSLSILAGLGLLTSLLSGCVPVNSESDFDALVEDAREEADKAAASTSGGTTSGSTTSGTTSGSTTSGSTTSGSTTSGTTGPPTGFFTVKVYLPTGGCKPPNGSNYTGNMWTTDYCPRIRTTLYRSSVILPDPIFLGTSGTDAGGKYEMMTYGLDGSVCEGRLTKIEWNLRPDMPSPSSACNLVGSASIDFQGQNKLVVIRW